MATRSMNWFGRIGTTIALFAILLVGVACQPVTTVPTQAENPVVEVAVEVEATEVLTDAVVAEVVDNTLSVPELWPDWENGSGEFSVPAGFEAWLTTDPGRIFVNDADEPLAEFAERTVVLLSEGNYRLETYVSAEGNINGWMEATRVELFTLEAPVEQAVRMHDELGNPALIVDLRTNPVAAVAALSMDMVSEEVFVAPEENKLPSSAAVVTEVVEAPAAVVDAEASATEVVTEVVEAPAAVVAAEASATEVVTEVVEAPAAAPVQTCVPEDSSFAAGYADAGSTAVVLHDESRWILAGMDPASLNGEKHTNKVLAVVSPGKEVSVVGLGYSNEGRAYMYACAFNGEPDQAMIDSWAARESNGGDRVVDVVKF